MPRYVIADLLTPGRYIFTIECDAPRSVEIAEGPYGLSLPDYTITEVEAWKLTVEGLAYLAVEVPKSQESMKNAVLAGPIQAANIAPAHYDSLTAPQQAELDAYVLALVALKNGYVGDPTLMVLPAKPAFL
jgi:hypothetical protein